MDIVSRNPIILARRIYDVNIKQHFQDWGNLYQVFVGLIFGFISVILWYRDRNKQIKIKELTEQSKVLRKILDVLISPSLEVKNINEKSGAGFNHTVLFQIHNSGGVLYDLGCIKRSQNKRVVIIDNNDKKHLTPNQSFEFEYSTIGNTSIWEVEAEIIFYFKDRLKRRCYQTLVIRGHPYFEPLEFINDIIHKKTINRNSNNNSVCQNPTEDAFRISDEDLLIYLDELFEKE